MQVASHQYSYVIERNSTLFKGCNLQFLNQLLIKLRETYLMPGEVMVREGDMARELGFVASVILPPSFSSSSLSSSLSLK